MIRGIPSDVQSLEKLIRFGVRNECIALTHFIAYLMAHYILKPNQFQLSRFGQSHLYLSDVLLYLRIFCDVLLYLRIFCVGSVPCPTLVELTVVLLTTAAAAAPQGRRSDPQASPGCWSKTPFCCLERGV